MSKKATEFQKREMSKMYRGKQIFKPLNTGWVDEHVACVREWVANIFFYPDSTGRICRHCRKIRLRKKYPAAYAGWAGYTNQRQRDLV